MVSGVDINIGRFTALARTLRVSRWTGEAADPVFMARKWPFLSISSAPRGKHVAVRGAGNSFVNKTSVTKPAADALVAAEAVRLARCAGPCELYETGEADMK